MNKEFDEGIINQLVAFNVAEREEIMNAMQHVTNPNDINEITEYIDSHDYDNKVDDADDNDDDDDADDDDQTIQFDQLCEMLAMFDNNIDEQMKETKKVNTEQLPYSLTEIKAGLSQSSLIWDMNVPDYIVNIIALCSLVEFELIIDESMVLSVSAPEWSRGYGLNKLFIESECYCTAKNNEVEIVIDLSVKNHCSDPSKYDSRLDENGFIIKEIKVKPPSWGFTAPIKTFMLWVFNDKNKIPNKQEIKDKYGGQIDVKSLDIYDKQNHTHLRNKEIEKKCVVCIDNIKKGDEFHTCQLYDDLNSNRIVKAKYILIKLMTPSSWDNVDTQQFCIKVMRL